MNGTKRDDIHRPSTINPDEYDLVCFTYRGTNPQAALESAGWRAIVKAHQDRTGGVFARIDHAGGCDICGSWFTWGAVFHHAATNAYIETGWICADKMHFDADGTAFRSWKKRVQEGAELRAGKNKARMTLEEAGLSRAWEIYESDDAVAEHQVWANDVIKDIVFKLVRYGSLSSKQINFLSKLVDRFDKPAPVRKTGGSFVGTIKKRDFFDVTIAFIAGYESDYGYVTVYGMEDADENLLVWKTTAALAVGESEDRGTLYARKGDALRIKATVKNHVEYKGRNQTQVNRVVVDDVRSLVVDRKVNR